MSINISWYLILFESSPLTGPKMSADHFVYGSGRVIAFTSLSISFPLLVFFCFAFIQAIQNTFATWGNGIWCSFAYFATTRQWTCPSSWCSAKSGSRSLVWTYLPAFASLIRLSNISHCERLFSCSTIELTSSNDILFNLSINDSATKPLIVGNCSYCCSLSLFKGEHTSHSFPRNTFNLNLFPKGSIQMICFWFPSQLQLYFVRRVVVLI